MGFEYHYALNQHGELFDCVYIQRDASWLETLNNPKLQTAVSKLNDRQKLLLELRFEKEWTQERIALFLQVRQAAVTQQLKKIFEQILNNYR